MTTQVLGNYAPAPFTDEASSYDGRISATTRVGAEAGAWLRLPSVSGIECVRALRHHGFVIQANVAGYADLHRRGDVVRVPLVDRLSPDVLVPLLVAAGVGPLRFLALLEATT